MATERTQPGMAGTQREENTGFTPVGSGKIPLERFSAPIGQPIPKEVSPAKDFFSTGPPQWNPYQGALANLWDIATDPVYFVSGEDQNAAEKAVATIISSFQSAITAGRWQSKHQQLTPEDVGFLQSFAQALGTMTGFALMLAGPSKLIAGLGVPEHLAPLVTGAIYGTAQPADSVAERFNNAVNTTGMFGAFHFGSAGIGKLIPKSFSEAFPRAAGFAQSGVPFGAFEAASGAAQGLPMQDILARTAGATLGGGLFGLGMYKGGEEGQEIDVAPEPGQAGAADGEFVGPVQPAQNLFGDAMEGFKADLGKIVDQLSADAEYSYSQRIEDARRQASHEGAQVKRGPFPALIEDKIKPPEPQERARPAQTEIRDRALSILNEINSEMVEVETSTGGTRNVRKYETFGEKVREARRRLFSAFMDDGSSPSEAARLANEALMPEIDQLTIMESPEGSPGVTRVEPGTQQAGTIRGVVPEGEARTLGYEKGRYRLTDVGEPDVTGEGKRTLIKPGSPEGRGLSGAEERVFEKGEQGTEPIDVEGGEVRPHKRDTAAEEELARRRAEEQALVEPLPEDVEADAKRTEAARKLADGRTFELDGEKGVGYMVDPGQTDADQIAFVHPDGKVVYIEGYEIKGPANDKTVSGVIRNSVLTYVDKKGVAKVVEPGEMSRKKMRKLGVRETVSYDDAVARQIAPTKARGRTIYYKRGKGTKQEAPAVKVTTTRTPEETEAHVAEVNRRLRAKDKNARELQLLKRKPKPSEPEVPVAQPPETSAEIEQRLLDSTSDDDPQRIRYNELKKKYADDVGEERAHEIARMQVFSEQAEAERAEQVAEHDFYMKEQSRLEHKAEGIGERLKASKAAEKELEGFRKQQAIDRERDPEGREQAVRERMARDDVYRSEVKKSLESAKKAIEAEEDPIVQKEIIDKVVETLSKDGKLNSADVMEMMAELYGAKRLKAGPRAVSIDTGEKVGARPIEPQTEQDALTDILSSPVRDAVVPGIGTAGGQLVGSEYAEGKEGRPGVRVVESPTQVERAQIIQESQVEEANLQAKVDEYGRRPKQQVSNMERGEVWYDPATGNLHWVIFPTRKTFAGEYVPHPTRFKTATKADKRGAWMTIRLRPDGKLDSTLVTNARNGIRGIDVVEVKDMKNWYNLGRMDQATEGRMAASAQEMYEKSLATERAKTRVGALDAKGNRRPIPKDWGKTEEGRKKAIERDSAITDILDSIDYNGLGARPGGFTTSVTPQEPKPVYYKQKQSDTWYTTEAQKKRAAQRVARELDMPEPLRDDLDPKPTTTEERRELGKYMAPDEKILASDLMNDIIEAYRGEGRRVTSQEAEDIVLDALLEGNIPEELKPIFRNRC